MYNIAMIGAGYVGLVSAACFAHMGFNVICLDFDKDKIKRLNSARVPIYEPGLEDMLRENIDAGRLYFTDDYKTAVSKAQVVFIAVGTPSDEDGSADLRYVIQAAVSIAGCLDKYTVIVNKSTVPLGTGQLVKQTVKSELEKHGKDISFDVVSNPEFLREGSAIQDFMKPDRVIIGTESQKAQDIMAQVYKGLPVIFSDIETAELIKYASNAYLSTKISFMNEIALLCEEAGADVSVVSRAMGRDTRIGSEYLSPGPGYGGSCFPKDTRALVSMGRDYGVNMSVVEATIRANENQRRHMVLRIVNALHGAKGRRIAVLGLSFKPETDDVREAPAVGIVKALVYRGAQVHVYDPAAMENTKEKSLAGLNVSFEKSAFDAVYKADAVVVVTEWNEFKQLDMKSVLEAMAGKHLFDLRNIYSRDAMEELGYTYYGVGRMRAV